ncbi:TRZ/ATZ family hydrolase [Uliginosibacterium sp. H1]|uniref:TRZ/ATZ family hydrolase n=1 Tax=Uliginosibacterium sp. H1 TaxID=3114757 RepID=UPI002E17481A|nr:TRZ/ATZ family hydrolase [Uliginosibacterium sp. H1]
MTPPTAVDSLIEARWIVPIEPAEVVLEHHAVAIREGLIVDLLPIEQARQRYLATEHVVLEEHVLMPGLVNAHTHAAMTLLRGFADDLPLMTWLNEAIWPAEREHASPEFVRDGTRLAAAEMLRGGITCVQDMYFYPDAAAEAFSEAGMRAVLSLPVMEFPSRYAADADDYLRKGLAVRDQWRDRPLLGFALGPHAPYSVSDASFERVVALSQELDCPIHIHLHETRTEVEDSIRHHGMRPLERLERLGLLGPGLSVAHAVHLTEGEIRLLAERNVSVVHNPTSNMKLASGIAPVARMLESGIAVGLGTDGAASNNRLDLWQEMRQASLLAKVAGERADALPAHRALRMATLDGARCLGLDDRIGSIQTGKEADLCAISLSNVDFQPCYDPVSHLVYVVDRHAVSDVWVAGNPRVRSHSLLQFNNIALQQISRSWQNSLY